ncbi:BTAD domain-containing putative transcriptional regulator [Paractinoplanes deccanensis]|uniref:BTAD domain-containing putative transcriptional regulator n=1 Tax=Paractinoplanes deccanensis TaxID=113561 RepID=UPI001942746A|nr:BTAD domain-containing putative transcriptional regulator [Actinoplanes deccanensis]
MLIGKVLGSTEVEMDGVPAELGGPLPRRLVAALLAAEGRPVSEDALAEAVWGGEVPARPAASLQAYVSRLRRSFEQARGPGSALARAGDGYRLTVGDTDAAGFTADVRRGRALLDEERPGDALRAFDAALARWRGEAYADLPETPARTRLEELRAVAVEERLAARLATGDAPGAVGELEAAVRDEPYRERRWELLILALYRGGRQAEALAALRRVRARLADELGIDPGPALQELEGRLLAQDPGLLLPSRPAPAVRPLSHFFGRTEELAALAELSTTGRLVTLVGPGGAGKTRLAVEFAAPRDPWFARLADVAEPTLVPAAVAAALGVRGSTAEAIATALGDRPGLLLLDNCEHVVRAAAELTLVLLARCPGLRVLATSREPLGVDGERLLPVAPLPAGDAVALLTDRITAVRPGWRPDAAERAALDGLATALDGIPLALELAAARARVLGLAELLEMLHGRFPALGPVPRGALAPHETLEAAVAWSVDLLSAHDRAVLLRLWPFEGGFPLSAVDDDLDALSALVARSVVVADTTVTPARYRLLEILRAYCRGRDDDPAGSRARHAAWVRSFVERTAPELRGERSAHAIRLLNRELANIRAGIAHDLHAAPRAALRTAGLLEWFWFRGGLVTEGGRLLRAALDGAPDAPPADRARALSCLGTLCFMTGDEPAAEKALRDAIDVLGPSPDREGWTVRAQLHYYESLLRSATGRYEEAVAEGRHAMAVGRRIGEERLVAAGEMTLGWALAAGGDPRAGRRELTGAIRRATAIGQRWTTAMSELLLGRALLLSTGDEPADPAAALAALRRAVDHFTAEDDVGNVLACLFTGAQALIAAGRRGDGVTLAAAVRRNAARRGISPGAADPLGAAALADLLAGVDPATVPAVDEDAMIGLLGPPARQD